MTTVSQIITDAYRQSNLLAIGTSPTIDQQTEALRYLDRLVQSAFGHEAGEPLVAFPIGDANYVRPAGYPGYSTVPHGDWYIPVNTRAMLNLDESTTLYLHPAPYDGARFAVTDINSSLATNPVTLNGNGRLIENTLTLELNEAGLDREWFYRADLGAWKRVSPLALVDEFPFPKEFDDFFITMLAIRFNPAYGASIDSQTQAVLARASKQLKARYSQISPAPSEIALIRLSKMAADRDLWYNNYWPYDTGALFNKGWPW